MTCTTNDNAFAPCASDGGSATRGILAMIANGLRGIGRAVIEARQRQVERQMVAILARSGWRLTDDVERQMMEHLCGPRSGLDR